MTKPIIKKVSKGKTQNRVTIPKEWSFDYVKIEPLEILRRRSKNDKE